MDTVLPFRAWRYSPEAGDAGLLVAPPYDVIGPELQSRLYARSRYNVVRVDLGMTTPSDNYCDNRYTRAASQLEQWKAAGVLVRDDVPTLTFVEEEFTGPDGRSRTRRGFLAAVRLHGLSEGVIHPHEQTFSGPKQDRFDLMEATSMSLSPVFLLYDLPGDEVAAAWSSRPDPGPPAAQVSDEDGNVTKLWPTSDPTLLDTVRRSLEHARFVIADGHHRYETALRYRDHRRERDSEAKGGVAPNSTRAYEYVLAYLSNMADPGLAIYGTHRLVAGIDPRKMTALQASLTGTFAVEPLTPAEPGAAGAREVIERYLGDHPRGAFGVWAPALGGAYGLQLLDDQPLVAVTPDHSPAYRALDVTILQKLILEPVLAIPSEGPEAETLVTYFKDTNAAFERLEAGDFQAGFFMNPTGLDQVREVAFGGERMPQKATFFYPKLPTGLVFHDLGGVL